MNNKILAALFMILGTSVGAGMLALPIATATQSIWLTLLMLATCWLMMTSGALAILEINLSMPDGSNMVTMAEKTLGKPGKWLNWVIYLGLLYCLLCAYIAGTSDILAGLLSSIHLHPPRFVATILATGLLGIIVYRGIHSVAQVNRWLMSIKLLSYITLVVILSQQFHSEHLIAGNFTPHYNTLMIMITAYGFAIIVPSLRTYLHSNRPLLVKILCLGSLLPFVIYTLWILIIQGVILRYGDSGLIAMAKQPSETNSLLIQALVTISQNRFSATLIKLFVAICALTSFLGVALSLTDCLADSLHLQKQGRQGLIVAMLTFLPPLLIVLVKPGVFLLGLSHAGLFCLWLLIGMPMLMLYRQRRSATTHQKTILPGGVLWLSVCVLFAMVMTIFYFI